MRVDSILAINANQQHNPHTAKYAGTSTGKSASGIIFEDFLRANLQQESAPVVTSQTENQLAGLLGGYFSQLRITYKTEPKTEENVS